jgi:hypothetical protein
MVRPTACADSAVCRHVALLFFFVLSSFWEFWKRVVEHPGGIFFVGKPHPLFGAGSHAV